ncbi:MAG: hypothetical protein BRC47_07640 [Cyanobacteria bacterium QS_7_48_42]|nr:MAG: hypothetical protein BRC42_15675 [Cyanobacteria bacterium QS_1_48_34]PSP02496.1 MAG: hypothetical protein BRC47_07640 [Cyanobacteria bacterium QS_7_48_42]PSP36773.1 MAG: hypothetical protein BRC57_00585 [Cyanobacteria bacterium QS_8_48_54]
MFGDKQTEAHLLLFGWFNLERHTMVKGKASQDDPNLKEYWERREKKKVKTLNNQSLILVAALMLEGFGEVAMSGV